MTVSIIHNDERLQTIEIIKTTRKEKKLTLKQLAEKVDSTDSYILLIEQGKRNISFDFADKLSRVLGLQVEQLKSIIGKNQIKTVIAELEFLKAEKTEIALEIKRIRSMLWPISDENEEMIDQALLELEERLSN
jgi:transcriptional regulator with XRE-family HTH domain